MKSSIAVVLIAIVPLITSCKKKPAETTSGSAAEPAGSAAAPAGSAAAPAGSAAAPAGSAAAATGSAAGSAAAAPAGAPADLKVMAKHSGADAGTFDGAKAIYFKDGKDRNVLIPGDCAFGCDTIGKDGLDYKKVQKVCPSASWVVVKVNGINQEGEPKVGATKVTVHLGTLTGGQDLTGGWTDGGTLTEVAADHISGKVDLKDGGDELHGAFTAKICP